MLSKFANRDQQVFCQLVYQVSCSLAKMSTVNNTSSDSWCGGPSRPLRQSVSFSLVAADTLRLDGHAWLAEPQLAGRAVRLRLWASARQPSSFRERRLVARQDLNRQPDRSEREE